MRQVIGVLLRPRVTMAEVVRHPTLITTWVVVLLVAAACGGSFLLTRVGRQALVDERVRVVEALGGRVDDVAYGAWQADPPTLMYLTSGGRLALTPPVTLLVALGVVAVAAADGKRIRYGVALAVAVHASVVLALGQVVSTPLHYLRESLTSPTNLAGLLPALDEGSWPARLLGAVDLFGLWWVWVLAVGLAAATGTSPQRHAVRLLGGYFGIAAIVATVSAVVGAGAF